MRITIRSFSLAVAHMGLVLTLSLGLPDPLSGQGVCQGESRNFDFWIGEWDVLNRNRGSEDPRWYDTGAATARINPVVAGCGIVEHWRGNGFPDRGVGGSGPGRHP